MSSKLTGMLASGRPALATAKPGTELALVVSGSPLPVIASVARQSMDCRAALAMTTESDGLAMTSDACGVVVRPEDPQTFADVLVQLAHDAPARARMGQAARSYAEANLHIDAVLGRLVARVQSIIYATKICYYSWHKWANTLNPLIPWFCCASSRMGQAGCSRPVILPILAAAPLLPRR